MEEFQGPNFADSNFDYDLIEDPMKTLNKGKGESTLYSSNNLIKNSKLKFCDLILIDNHSNFLDLKMKMEINPNKNNKSQFSLLENVIKFTNFFETTNNILSRLNYDSTIYTISYFGDKLEKICYEIDINNYQGKTIYLKICERYNKRNNVNNSSANLTASYRRNYSCNSKINNNNYNKENNFEINLIDNSYFKLNNEHNSNGFSATNLSESKQNNITDKYNNSPLASRTNVDFCGNKKEKKKKNLTDLIEANLNGNLAIKNRRSQSNKKNINPNNHCNKKMMDGDLINHNFFTRTIPLKREPFYFIKKLKFSRNNNPNKEKPYFNPLLYFIGKKDALENNNNNTTDNNNYLQFKNKFKKEKLLKNEILFKNRKLITDQINSHDNLENINSNINDNQLKESCNKTDNALIFGNHGEKRIIIIKKYKKDEEKGSQNLLLSAKTDLENSNLNRFDKLKTFEKISSNNLTNFCNDKNKPKNSFVDSYLAKKLDNNIDIETFPMWNSERKPVSLIGKFQKSQTQINETRSKFRNKDDKEINEREEDTTPYLLTNQSYSDKIKPRVQVSDNNNDKSAINKKLNYFENKGSLSSENFYGKAKNNLKLTTENKHKVIKPNNAATYDDYFYKKQQKFSLSAAKLDLLEEEFFNKKISFTRNPASNKFSNLVVSKSNMSDDVMKGKNNLESNVNPQKISQSKSNNNFLNSHLTSSNRKFSTNNDLRIRSSHENIMDINANKAFTNLIDKNLISPNSNSNVSEKFVSNFSVNKNMSNGFKKNNILNNNLLDSDKAVNLNQTFSKLKETKTNNLELASNNKIDKRSRKTASINSMNFESLVPSIKIDKSEKNIINDNYYIGINDINEDENRPSSKQNHLEHYLKIEEPSVDLDKTFSNYFENIGNNETDNMQGFNLNNKDNFDNKSELIYSSNSENRLFNNPTLNSKLLTTYLNNQSENDSNCKRTFLKDSSSKRKHREYVEDPLTNKNNKFEIKDKSNNIKADLTIKMINNANSIKSKSGPNIDKKTSEEVKATRNLIHNFISNNLNIIITDKFIEENLQWLILSDFYRLKSQDIKIIKSSNHGYTNKIIEDYHTSNVNFLGELKLKSSVIENYNENLISVETDPAQKSLEIGAKDIQLAREFIFYCYLNCKSLEKFFYKKLNKNEFAVGNSTAGSNNPINKSLNFMNLQSALGDKNLNYTNLCSTAANEQNWFNCVSHCLALELLNTANNSKQISEFNLLIEEVLKRLKKDISGLLNFMNFISSNKLNLQIKNFALDLIFVNLYIVDAKSKAIDEKIVYLLIEFIANEKEKKLFFENYKRLRLLSDQVEFAKSNKDFYKSKFLFFRGFIKMVLKNSQDNVDMIKKSFDITDQEVYFILFSDFNELKEYIDDKDFKNKISSMFDLLIDSLK